MFYKKSKKFSLKKQRLPSITFKTNNSDEKLDKTEKTINSLISFDKKNLFSNANLIAKSYKSTNNDDSLNLSETNNDEKRINLNHNIFRNKDDYLESNFKKNNVGPKYDSNGKIINYSILGSIGNFTKMQTKIETSKIEKQAPKNKIICFVDEENQKTDNNSISFGKIIKILK